jgi:hypothetical protein
MNQKLKKLLKVIIYKIILFLRKHLKILNLSRVSLSVSLVCMQSLMIYSIEMIRQQLVFTFQIKITYKTSKTNFNSMIKSKRLSKYKMIWNKMNCLFLRLHQLIFSPSITYQVKIANKQHSCWIPFWAPNMGFSLQLSKLIIHSTVSMGSH